MVIDASVAFKLVIEEPDSDKALDFMASAELIAPTLIHAEVANGLWKRVIRREIHASGELDLHLANLSRYVRTVDETRKITRALHIANDLGHAVYDCVYLAVAEHHDDELLTADDRFLRKLAGSAYASRVRNLSDE